MSLFQDIGGESAVSATVDLFYDKVLADPEVNYFFDGMMMNGQKKMLRHFVTFAFGGPNDYTGTGMREAHTRQVEQGLKEFHFDRIMDHLGSTLQELGVPNNKITEAANVANSVRGDVLGH